MRRKGQETKVTNMLVFEYVALPPIEHADLVDQQMRLAHKYQNRLIELERAQRGAYRALRAKLLPEVDAVETEMATLKTKLETLRTGIKAERQAKRKRSIGEPVQQSEIAQVRAALKTLRERLKVLREEAKLDETFSTEALKLNAAHDKSKKDARATCGLYWGTYLRVEKAVEQALKRSKTDPKFKRWDGHGHVACQIQNGLPTEEAFGDDTRVRISPRIPDEIWQLKGRKLEKMNKCELRVRVASGPGRAPVFAVIPFQMSRPLPPGTIRWVDVLRERVAHEYRWKVQFSMDVAPGHRLKPATTSKLVAGLDVGWRVMPTGLRVGYLVDSLGEEREFILPKRVVGKLDHADSLRSIRDRNFDDVRAQLRGWLDGFEGELPAWLTERCATMHAWRSCARLAMVAIFWRSSRFDGDEAGYALVEAWRKQDKHLWTWEAHERRRAGLWRREIYRCWAAELTTKYGHIVIEDFRLDRMARKGNPEETPAMTTALQLLRTRAAISTFRSALKNAARARDATLEVVLAVDTTRKHHVCAHIAAKTEKFVELMHTCTGCGATYDQDANAAKNLLAAAGTGDTSPLDDEDDGNAPPPEDESMAALSAEGE